MENLKKYQDIFINVFNVTPDVLNENFTFKDTETWDSITHMSLISELEDTFEVMFETEEIIHYYSYENGMKILADKGVAFSC